MASATIIDASSAILAKHGLDGFFKVAEENGSCAYAGFWNPETDDFEWKLVKDHTSDVFYRNDELYNLPVDEEVRRDWLHSRGKILVGDTVMVVKGRAVKPGTVSEVRRIEPVYDKYRRVQAHFCYLTNGERTYVHNVRLVEDA